MKTQEYQIYDHVLINPAYNEIFRLWINIRFW